MSLRGYVKKTKPALWKQAADEAGVVDHFALARQQYKAAKVERRKREQFLAKLKRQPKQRKRVRQVSKHHAEELAEYRRRAPVYLNENPVCLACPKMVGVALVVDERPHRSESVHHKRGRLGPLLLDERHWLPTCIHSHDWIHSNIALARSLDLIAQPGQWNRYEP